MMCVPFYALRLKTALCYEGPSSREKKGLPFEAQGPRPPREEG